MTLVLELSDLKAAMVTMLHELMVNILEINEKIEILGREIETIKRTKK